VTCYDVQFVSTLSKGRNFTIESFDSVACCFDIVAGVDGVLVAGKRFTAWRVLMPMHADRHNLATASVAHDSLQELMDGEIKRKVGVVPPNVTWGGT